MPSKRMIVSLATGALLGVVCIVGAQVRSGYTQSVPALFSLWYNRVIIGLAVGLAGRAANKMAAVQRGALLGFLVSFAYYASIAFKDVVSFLAGIVYGILIELAADRFEKQKTGK